MSDYKNKIVAVTGGTGLIGSRLAERLSFEEGAYVKVLVHNWNKATWVSRADVDLIPGDITQIDSLMRLLQDAEIVFNCAVSGQPELCRLVNVEGTRNVVEACIKSKVKRIVHFSTIGVHGPYLHEGMDENIPFVRHGNAYADSKIEAEELFWSYLSDHNLERVVVRPTYIWGPNSQRFTIEPIKQMIGKKFAFVDDGNGACNAVYVDNVVDLALLAGIDPRAIGEAFFIRDPDRMTWKEFFAYYAAIASIDPETLMTVSSKKSLKTDLGWKIKKLTDKAGKLLMTYIDKYNNRYPIIVRYGLKAPLKILRMGTSVVDSVFPTPYSWWDLKKYSSPGYISTEKAKKFLDYCPRVTTKTGRDATKTWLKEQNYLPDTDAVNNACL